MIGPVVLEGCTVVPKVHLLQAKGGIMQRNFDAAPAGGDGAQDPAEAGDRGCHPQPRGRAGGVGRGGAAASLLLCVLQ